MVRPVPMILSYGKITFKKGRGLEIVVGSPGNEVRVERR